MFVVNHEAVLQIGETHPQEVKSL